MFTNMVQRLTIVALGFGLLFLGQSASAATFTWNSNTSGSPVDGSGQWNTITSNTNWWNGTADVKWPGFSPVVFGVGAPASNPYTVDLGGSLLSSGASIIFQNQAYTISNGSLTLSAPTITVNSTSGGTISATINASGSPLIKAGSGSLTLSNTGNSYTGSTQVQGGTLVLGANNTLPVSASALVLGSGASNGTVD